MAVGGTVVTDIAAIPASSTSVDARSRVSTVGIAGASVAKATVGAIALTIPKFSVLAIATWNLATDIIAAIAARVI